MEINFSDGTNWFDTTNSSYLVYENNEIKFKKIMDFVEGDIVILVDTSNSQNVQIQQKIVQSTTLKEKEFSGWTISVEREHLFLTVTSPNATNVSFAAVEHNECNCIDDTTCGKGYRCFRCICTT